MICVCCLLLLGVCLIVLHVGLLCIACMVYLWILCVLWFGR